MSEQTKEPDIVERLEAAFTPSKSGVLPSRKLYREAAGEITRLRAERPGWREPTAVMLDAMQAECPEIGRHYLRAIWRVGFAALHPSVAEPDAPKEEQTCEHEWSEWAKVGRHVERKCSKCGKEQYDD